MYRAMARATAESDGWQAQGEATDISTPGRV